MQRGTSLTLVCTIQGIKLSSIADIYLTLKQPTVEITKSGKDIEIHDNEFYVDLSQKEMLALKRGNVMIQARFKDVDGYYWATDIAVGDVESILYDKEIR